MFSVTIEPPYKDIGLIPLGGEFPTYDEAYAAGVKWLDGAVGRIIIKEAPNETP